MLTLTLTLTLTIPLPLPLTPAQPRECEREALQARRRHQAHGERAQLLGKRRLMRSEPSIHFTVGFRSDFPHSSSARA
jgi:hypothetical protein